MERTYLFRYNASLKLIWSRPLGIPTAALDLLGKQYLFSHEYCRDAIDGNITTFDPVYERPDGTIIGIAQLRYNRCVKTTTPTWLQYTIGEIDAVLTLSPYGDLDCSPTPDLCQGKNVLVDCTDHNPDTLDDCQHSVGCYHIHKDFLNTLSPAKVSPLCLLP